MQKLTVKEEELMCFFWEKGALFVKDILDFYHEPKPHFNTLSTIVRGLEEKGFLSHKAYGNTHRYHAIISREEYSRENLTHVVNKYFGHSYLHAVSALVKSENITIEELKQLISEVENQSVQDGEKKNDKK
jgi:predicted transcriptional regulator